MKNLRGRQCNTALGGTKIIGKKDKTKFTEHKHFVKELCTVCLVIEQTLSQELSFIGQVSFTSINFNTPVF